ncbi:WPE palindromic element domain-containing protein [Wolbachia endosymbiont of Ctenocephalides felis wCfeJ]|uniref:WPE palindromic element domain-containing protein n=1 Tax=Wolbachia endosymbiont of Ctenocephalides felis wCfeJ TaxID=2732594 RepID=UPI001447EFCD|nr:WPE palindromic element domain-containing protein [Wolbachia endosymbiont of Ctenocephalides felis wCfeJ]
MEIWIPVSRHWDDIIMLLGCIVEVKWMTPANYLLIAMFVTIMQEVYHHLR